MSAIKDLYRIEAPRFTCLRTLFALSVATAFAIFAYKVHAKVVPSYLVGALWVAFFVLHMQLRRFLERIGFAVLVLVHTFTLIGLALAYYLIFFPLGLLLRSRGDSALLVRIDTSLKTYREVSPPLRPTTFTEPY